MREQELPPLRARLLGIGMPWQTWHKEVAQTRADIEGRSKGWSVECAPWGLTVAQAMHDLETVTFGHRSEASLEVVVFRNLGDLQPIDILREHAEELIYGLKRHKLFPWVIIGRELAPIQRILERPIFEAGGRLTVKIANSDIGRIIEQRHAEVSQVPEEQRTLATG